MPFRIASHRGFRDKHRFSMNGDGVYGVFSTP